MNGDTCTEDKAKTMSEDNVEVIKEEMTETNLSDAEKVKVEDEEETFEPHPFYAHCSPTLKTQLTDEILPLAKQYAIVYHTHEKTEEDAKEPYKYAYEARHILETCLELAGIGLIEIFADKYESEYKDADLFCFGMLNNFLNYQIGRINNQVEERGEAEKMLMKSFESLKKMASLGEMVSLYCSVCCELGLVWAQRGENEKAKEYLTCGLSAFEDYKAEYAPIHVNELFCPASAEQTEEARRFAWERVHTHILYYLAQVYGHLGEFNKAAVYCRRTLVRQLDSPPDQFDPVEWSFNAATLSNFYTSQQRFAVARHCIACAHVVFYKYLEKVNLEEMSEAKKERVERNKSDIARFWIKLSKLIMTESSRMFQAKIDYDTEAEEDLDKIKQIIEMSKGVIATAEKVSVEDLFEGIDVSEIETRVRVVTSTYKEAKEVFLFAQEQITIALAFFPLNGYVTDHIEVLQDSSNLYKLLSKFELDSELKCRMHKRRVDLLEEPSNTLNTQHYLMICRQMWYEIGIIIPRKRVAELNWVSKCVPIVGGDCIAFRADTSMDMAALKCDLFKGHISRAPLKIRQKYNKLNQQSHKYFQKFHDSIKPEKNGEYELELIRPLVLSKMGMAKSKSNLLCNEREQFRFMNEALKEYKWIVKYLDSHPDAKEKCPQQYPLIKQMTELLPFQLERFFRTMS